MHQSFLTYRNFFYLKIALGTCALSIVVYGLHSPVEPPNGEWFPAIAARLQSWLDGLDPSRPVLAISHGITARVLRGLLVGGDDWHGVRVADDAPQGTVFRIVDGVQSVLLTGSGVQGVRAA